MLAFFRLKSKRKLYEVFFERERERLGWIGGRKGEGRMN